MTTYIAIEGIDGSGKATQANLLADNLLAGGVSAKVISFPDYTTTYGKKIAAYLRGEYGELKDLHPDLIAPLYALNRCELRNKIQLAAIANKVVIFDRYTGSNMAHQGAKIEGKDDRVEFYSQLIGTEMGLLNAVLPRLTFFLDVAVSAAQSNVDSKETRAYTSSVRDLHEADTGHLTSAREAYLEIAALEKWVVVGCAKDGVMRPANEIGDQIISTVLRYIGIKNILY